jgi:hypothetical protein
MHALYQPVQSGSFAQPLGAAADYLETYGWSQHQLYAPDAPAASLVGALAIVCYGYPHPDPFGMPNITHAEPGAYTAFIIAGLILSDFIGAHEVHDGRGRPVVYTLQDWNDEPYMSAACLIATLRAAAADYDQGGAS